jgi:inner membrane protease subunit 2
MAPTINPTVHETGQRDVVFTRPYTHHEKAINVESGLAGKDKSKGWGVSNGGIKRGDVVTFWKPHKPEEIGIKRVIAVEGDVVWPKNGYAMSTSAQAERLSGMPDGLPDHDPDSVLSGREEKGRVVVPYGHVWVEGDNWRMSLDSRDNGPMAKGLIMGKVVGIWRGWGEFRGTRDERKALEKQGASRVEEGRSEVPSVFLE